MRFSGIVPPPRKKEYPVAISFERAEACVDCEVSFDGPTCGGNCPLCGGGSVKVYPRFTMPKTPKTVEEKRRELAYDYRVMAQWFRDRGDEMTAKDCEAAADQAAQLNLYEKDEVLRKTKETVESKKKQKSLF